jgi:chemotaxis protein methyltransferase CheR
VPRQEHEPITATGAQPSPDPDQGEPREFAFNTEDFNALRTLVHQTTGISLAESKRTLVYSRLARRLRALKLDSFAQYRQLLQSAPEGAEMVEFCNAITTNLTSFFRESHHFDYLRQHLLAPLASAPPRQRLRIWSAGCSTGEEPYSIAMTVYEALGEPVRADVRILATDLDSDVLAHAREGRYSQENVKDTATARVNRFFASDTGDDKYPYAIKPAVAQLITFKQLNLMHDLPMRGPLDAIFCRNVVIYFDKPTQRALFQRFARLQRPGDLLFIGHSESLYKVSEDYTLIGRTIYKRNERSD